MQWCGTTCRMAPYVFKFPLAGGSLNGCTGEEATAMWHALCLLGRVMAPRCSSTLLNCVITTNKALWHLVVGHFVCKQFATV